VIDTFDVARALGAALWVLFVPGLPIAIWSIGRGVPKIAAVAVAPVFSMMANFAILLVLNAAGVYLPLPVYGVVVSLISAAALYLLRRNFMSRRQLLATVVVVAVVGGFAAAMWMFAYHGYSFAAPNADAIKHTYWIRRMMEGNSILFTDFFTDNPSQAYGTLGVGGINQLVNSASYPPSWHTSMAVAISMFGAPVSFATLVSTLVFWSVGLTLGMLALTRAWGYRPLALGAAAALLAQVIPMVPGVPLSWGSMTSVIGISLLPGVVAIMVLASRSTNWPAWLSAVGGVLGLMLVHTPEGMTALLAGGIAVGSDLVARRRVLAGVGVAAVSVVAYLGLMIAVRARQPGTFQALASLKDRLSFDFAVDRFLSMSLNTRTYDALPHSPWIMWAVIAGIVLAVVLRRRPFLVVLVGLTFGIFLISASAVPRADSLVPFTYAWYASYERTAWVAMPFLAVLGAYTFVALGDFVRKRTRAGSSAVIAVVSLAFIALLISSAVPATAQLRRGVVDNPIPAASAAALASSARAGLHTVILTPAWSPSLLLYADHGLPVTNGAWLPSGIESDSFKAVLENPSVVCTDAKLARDLVSEGATEMVLSDRGVAWQGTIYSEESLMNVPGWKLTASYGGLYLYRLAQEACPVS
jgi:hypothetical protein